MIIVFPATNPCARIAEYFSGANRPIGIYAKASRSDRVRSTPIAMRSSKAELLGRGSTQIHKRASEPVPFNIRFTLLIFSARLKLNDTDAGLDSLRKDIKSARKGLKETCPAAANQLKGMLVSLDTKYAFQRAKTELPFAGGPSFRF